MPQNPLIRKLLFCAACAFSGWLTAFSMPPVSFWPLLFVGLSAFYWLYAQTKTPAQAFGTAFFFAIGYFTTGLWWIGNALLVEGSEFAWVWPISVIGLPTVLAFFTGTYVGIARLISNPHKIFGFLSFVLLLTFSEWTRGHAFTGFPWNLYGYTWADHLPMAQGFFLFGAFGMTLISILWAASAAFIFLQKTSWVKKAAFYAPVLLSMACLFFWGQNRLENNSTTYNEDAGVVVVQPNIEQTMKWDPDQIQDNFRKIISLSKAGYFGKTAPKNVFVVWPETAISPSIYAYSENMDAIRDMLAKFPTDSYLVTGILQRYRNGNETSYTNSVALLDENVQTRNIYNKAHLVPFGEYIPFQKWIPIAPVAAYNGFVPGKGPMTIEGNGIPPFSPSICYEIIFPDAVIERGGKTRPQWIANVTNDGWYGHSAGPYQHFAQTRLRAIEEGIPVIRSANTGISGVIDPYGRVLQRADIYQEAVLISFLPKPLIKQNALWPWAFQPMLILLTFTWLFVGFMHKIRRDRQGRDAA